VCVNERAQGTAVPRARSLDMKHNRQDQINSVYSAALQVRESERSSFVERECAGDTEFFQEVESLLNAHAQRHVPQQGDTLGDRLKRGTLPLEEVFGIAIDIATALDETHRKGEIHGDLNPDNIVLSKDGAGALRTLINARGGTAVPRARSTAYLALEQVQGKQADARTDIFALGAVIYEMATGRKAVEADSGESVAAATLSGEPPAITTVQPSIPPELDRLVKTCLAEDPEERWQTARDLVRELRWIADAYAQSLPVREETGRKMRERTLWLAAALLLLGLGLGSAILYFSYRQSPVQTGVKRFVLPPGKTTDLYGSASTSPFVGVGISPDGQQVVIRDRGSLWLRPLNSLKEERLPGTENSFSFCWSPDNRFILVFRGKQILKVAPNGQATQLICELPGWGFPGACNREGIILFWSHDGIWKVSANGGSPSRVIELDKRNKEIAAWPSFLPDGRHFVYVIYRSRWKALHDDTIVDKKDTLAGETMPGAGNSGIYVGSLDSKETRRLLDLETRVVYGQPGYLLYQRGSRLLAHPFDARRLSFTGDPRPIAEDLLDNGFDDAWFTVSDNGTILYRGYIQTGVQLIRVDRNGRQMETIGPPGDYWAFELSPDGKQVALEQGRVGGQAADIWTMDLQDGKKTQITNSVKAWNYVPRWSPDGKKIVFSSNRDAVDVGESHGNLYANQIGNGSGSETPLFKNSQWKYTSDWSPDGRYFLYLNFIGNPLNNSLWLLPLLGDPKPVPFLESAGDARFSPNGRWIAYMSFGSSDRFDIMVRSFPLAKNRWQISTRNAFNPLWRKDGKELYFIEPISVGSKVIHRLMSVAVKEASEASQSFQASHSRTLFDTPAIGGFGRYGYAPSPDGQSFYIFTEATQSPQVQAPVHVVLNWPELLPKK
jgi:serine/threonine protein kinase